MSDSIHDATLLNPQGDAPAGVRMRALLQRPGFWLPFLLGLHILILAHAAQWYVYAVFAGRAPHIWLYLRWAMSLWYTRAALVPPVVWIALRFRFRINHWARYFAIYVAASCCLAILASALQARVVMRLETGRYFYPNEEPALSTLHLTKIQALVVKGWPHLVYNMFTCWMLIGLVQGMCYYDDAHRRKMQALKLETQLATVKLKALRMQLNPHFLFNTLHAISTLIEEEPRVAEEMVLRLSNLLRSILDEENPEISLRQELCFLEDHIAIEKVRFGDRLTTNISVSESLLDCAVPHLILQPLVENVIQHGIGRHRGDDRIDIHASQESDLLCIELQNRNSRLEYSASASARVGIGLSNTEMRLQTLYRDRCSLHLDRLSPSGVSVKITLPFRKLPAKQHSQERQISR